MLGMRISRKAEYALRALIAMAREPAGRVHQIQELSRTENIPVKYLEQILLALRNGGLLGSKRGVGGGYTLQKLPAEISVGEVIELLDGPIAPIACALERPKEKCTCPDPAQCELRQFMRGVREQLDVLLFGKTIDDLLTLGRHRLVLAFDI
ncbi:MAG TPA: Rrf2 family transcriptional regulator [Chthoniobacterales bacterium]